ncbi:MAG: NAD(P)H-dependent glycerol-3-phosphate dehydrogenase [Candidatus Rhabdochlamydia sp.]
MKIGFLGAGTWGFSLASLLASQGHSVTLWGHRKEAILHLQATRQHPKLLGFFAHPNVTFTSSLEEAILDAHFLIEAVTAQGIRPVFKDISDRLSLSIPIILTSKGIEQGTGLLLPEVIIDVMGPWIKDQIGCITGPSHAEEVIKQLPTSTVASAYDPNLILQIHDLFSTPFFRVYPNHDLNGVCFGGAMKNIIAIACGISDGIGFGDNTKAALMTRGLHEIRKLSVTKEAKEETLNGLSGMGDLCGTCLSEHSRNTKFGKLIGKGLSLEQAKEQVGMVVEGVYTCLSALELAEKSGIAVPITEAVYSILYGKISPHDAVKKLLQRTIKEEHL